MKRTTPWSSRTPTPLVQEARTRRPAGRGRGLLVAGLGLALLSACSAPSPDAAQPAALDSLMAAGRPTPTFSEPAAFDVSPAFGTLARRMGPAMPSDPLAEPLDIRPERGPVQRDLGFSGDAALRDDTSALRSARPPASISAPLVTFEGLSNQDNFNLLGFRVNPPDPVGDVGPNHYVEMTNLAFAVYDKQGRVLLGPSKIGDLWAGFAVPDCTDASGDPIVVYDQLADRWILSQFTTRGLNDPALPFYNCVAISATGDPTGTYYRYAFTSGNFFPDYPKYGVWTDSYILTTREFGPTVEYGIGVYALEKNKMLAGDPKARAVRFFLDSAVVPINLMGDGLLPPDIDGTRRPQARIAAPIVGTQDDGGPYGADKDALNIYELSVQWNSKPLASFGLAAQVPVAAFDSIFPCAPTSRDCLAQPGLTNPDQKIDILSYRQRPTFRLAYRNFGEYEALVTGQSVEARPGVAGMRWYEIRRSGGRYSVYQQGTHAPDDGVQRWMGSVAMDRAGNMALGYSVVNGVDVFPGIRYTGRLRGDPLGQMTLGEGTIINGTGVQRSVNSRWGDYSSLNIDPIDDCTFWYVNEYYSAAGQASSVVGWQTRIGSFKTPECKRKED
ncbi:hypothetical protein [Deinococcus koreensis]|uniref:Uncharacterized protein n=1 Tax=Deinococcus koreensis TaxID=2054903 RepID=A0A2K3UV65_9DEIO|nr:hypothetical protein [Deinococcus koreensis]PNY80427.1 hypothetical protein CVO96_02725 [Deinococcus koreensis]